MVAQTGQRQNVMKNRRTRRSARSSPPAGHPGRSTTPTATLNAAVTAIVSNIRQDGTGLASELDPLEAELFASGILSMWHGDVLQGSEPFEILGTEIIQRLARKRDADALATLIAIGAIATPPFDVAAREAIDRLRSASVPEPVWSRTIGRPVLVDAWISTDELDDQSHLLAAFAYENLPAHAINLILDANFQGLIRDVFVAGNPDKVRREWIRASGLPIMPLDEQALADRVGRGIEMFDIYLDPPVTDQVEQLMPLLRARLRLLPNPRPIEVPETPDAEREAVLDAFAASSHATGLGEVDGRPATDIARWFIDFACDYGAGDPLRWSPIAVEILLTDWLPRKVILESAEVSALPDVLRSFVRYAAHRKGLATDVFAETLEAVDRFASDFTEGMADEERAGPAKELALAMRAAAIDLTDDIAVQRWIDERNRTHSP
jgi:hypothetical protein